MSAEHQYMAKPTTNIEYIECKWVKHHSYDTIRQEYKFKYVQWTEWFQPWMPHYRKPKAKSSAHFGVTTVITIIWLFEQTAPIPVCVYTHTCSNVEKTHLVKHAIATCT